MMPPSDMPRPKAGTRAKNDFWWATLTLAGWGLLLTGCQAPVGADRVSPRQVYEQVEANALGAGRPSADTVSLLHRYDLDALAAAQPVAAVRRQWPDTVNTGISFFVIFLYTKFFDWWWDALPKYLFFLVLGLAAVLILLVLRRLRGVLAHAGRVGDGGGP